MPAPKMSCWTPGKINQVAKWTLRDWHHTRKPLIEREFKNVMYQHVIREALTEFNHKEIEPGPGSRTGLFIKGYVHDIWAYFEHAYDMIHMHKWIGPKRSLNLIDPKDWKRDHDGDWVLRQK